VWECDPTGARAEVALPALGRWRHEAAAVDPDGEALYLTEDDPAGRLYRFTPDSYPDLAAGRLEAAVVDTGGAVTWVPVADPSAGFGPVHDQVPEATVFPGNEGIWYHDGTVVFTSKGDNRVHAIDLEASSTPCCGTARRPSRWAASTTSWWPPGPATSSWPRTAGTWSWCSSPRRATWCRSPG
jgi:secreted PhoX family phosphatase